MLPFSKTKWVVGCAGLSILLEQDRRHWLLKTDKLLQVQDTTGAMYQGQVDNDGNRIRLETQKLSEIHQTITDFEFSGDNVADVLAASNSALPFSYQVNGMACVRITSPQYNYNSTKFNYKIQFTNASIVYIPMGNSATSGDVYLFKFLKTTAPPSITFDNSGTSVSVSAGIKSTSATNVTYYYPLEDFQPLTLAYLGDGVYETELIDSDGFIGYPAYWFTCDETDHGPVMIFDETYGLMYYGNAGNSTRYNVNVYTGILADTTPDQTALSNYKIQVKAATGYTFANGSGDFNVPLDPTQIVLINDTTQTSYPLTMTNVGNNVITMAPGGDWAYDDETTYIIENSLGAYEAVNKADDENHNPLVALFNIQLDTTIPFTETTTDTGYVGIDMATHDAAYPYNLGAWNGIPSYLQTPDTSSPRMAIYAIHNTPSSSESNPQSRQTAGLLFDPGKPSTSPNGELAADEKGRVYVLSNDSIDYENNALAENPKPARTAARICDVPTSVVNLIDISGIAPTPIVDPKYVRSEASYSEDDQDKIANVLNSKWVRPTHVDVNNVPIYNHYIKENNMFVFQTMTGLNAVDLTLNGFRYRSNLNPMVQSSDVHIARITRGGTGYAVNDIGKVIIGGFAFTYTVNTVNIAGVVLTATLSAPPEAEINLSNFDMSSPTSSITCEYGTSPQTGSGSGLMLQLEIDDIESLRPVVGQVYDDLYAYVVTNNGLYIASYQDNAWRAVSKLCDYMVSDPSGDISYKDAYVNTIVPSVRDLPVAKAGTRQQMTSLQVLATSNFVNVVDTSKSPVDIAAGRDDVVQTEEVVDINKFRFDDSSGRASRRGTATSRTTQAVLLWITENDKPQYDSYLAWTWAVPSDPSNLEFDYFFIRRSFSNLQSYDNVNLLPPNNIPYKAFVNTDPATTIVWNVPTVGPMMWVFDPEATVGESYYLDPNTRDLAVSRQPITWENVDTGIVGPEWRVVQVDSSNRKYYRFNLHKIGSDGVYESTPFATYSNTYNNSDYQPKGAWKLVYPRVMTYHLSTDQASPAVEFTPARLQVLHTGSIQSDTDILDPYGQPVNAKTLIVEDNASGAKLKVFNQTTGNWDVV